MHILSMPLAAEQIKDEKLWTHFRNLAFENQDKLDFTDIANLTWCFTKADYHDAKLWRMLE